MCAPLDDPRKHYSKGRGLMTILNLNGTEIKALFVLVTLADDDGRVGLKRAELASRVGVSPNTLRGALRALNAVGIWDDSASIIDLVEAQNLTMAAFGIVKSSLFDDESSSNTQNLTMKSSNRHYLTKSSNARANITSFTNVKDSTLTKVKVGTATGLIDPPAVAALEPFSDDEIITDNDIASTLDDDPSVELDDEANEAIEEMASLWADLDPDALCLDPTPWFRKLIFEYGAEIPVAAIRQFYLDDRQLDDLENPVAFKGYFRRICDRLKTEGIPAPPVNGGVTSAANNPYKSNKNDPHYDKWSDPAQFVGLPASSITAECAE
jgi:hypothetical protein